MTYQSHVLETEDRARLVQCEILHYGWSCDGAKEAHAHTLGVVDDQIAYLVVLSVEVTAIGELQSAYHGPLCVCTQVDVGSQLHVHLHVAAVDHLGHPSHLLGSGNLIYSVLRNDKLLVESAAHAALVTSEAVLGHLCFCLVVGEAGGTLAAA